MEGNFNYTIDGVERKFFFGNYALEQTLLEFNVSVSDIADILDTKLLPFLRTFIFNAAAYPILEQGSEPDFTPFGVHKWIDATGGPNGPFMLSAAKKIYKALGVGESTTDAVPEKKSEK